ncbi:MAG: hypothetical protein ACTSP7_02855 [Candidatus Heimdallarchaeota archaeon]
MSLKEKFEQMDKGKKIFYIIAIILGFFALIGFILVAVGLSFSLSMVSLTGFILMAPFLVLLAIVWLSYARV